MPVSKMSQPNLFKSSGNSWKYTKGSTGTSVPFVPRRPVSPSAPQRPGVSSVPFVARGSTEAQRSRSPSVPQRTGASSVPFVARGSGVSSVPFVARGSTETQSSSVVQRPSVSSVPFVARGQRTQSPVRVQRTTSPPRRTVVKTVVAGKSNPLPTTTQQDSPFYQRVVEAERTRRNIKSEIVVPDNKDELLKKRQLSLDERLQSVTKTLIDDWAERHEDKIAIIVEEIIGIILSLIMGHRLWKNTDEQLIEKVIRAIFYTSSSGVNQLLSSGTTPYIGAQKGYTDYELIGEVAEEVVDQLLDLRERLGDTVDGILDRQPGPLYSLIFSVISEEREESERQNPKELEQEKAQYESEEFNPVDLSDYTETF